ncbi:helix-turn-helix domain-containing protein [Ruegeria sp. EL01]|uniref:helix-turn-helix domain-containing protein n=1 Tax=Ruegeria sp. EL01 TaxID=2107578 RepID=UPI0013C495D1|nr:AraC family transcriptional regulator [Ruegeria sp. EL01]
MPPKALASCVAAAVLRDIRGAKLSDNDRFNYFPVTPLVTATYIIEGNLHLTALGVSIADTKTKPKLPKFSITLPQAQPIVSWSPADAFAVSVAFYPDAWAALADQPAKAQMPEFLMSAFQAFTPHGDADENWQSFCGFIAPRWTKRRHRDGVSDWTGSDRLTDWSRHLFAKVALSSAGQSMRTFERYIRRWTGQSRQQIEFAVAMDALHHRKTANPQLPLADLASDAGYADQSHMGRAVRRSTGFSPARLNKMIETEEPFWCYRLLRERF